ncbi:FtsX-like permease family protein [Paenibacillus sp. SI8]|uniref:FtsX-like permease family protein n=1 Tax=unclassified Paenibacillus TaxID=185978 RepID=UPI0034668992
MKSLRGIAFRFFTKNIFVAVSSIFSVAISVALITSMMLFAFNAKESLHKEVVNTYGNMDISVGYNANQNKAIDNDLLDFVASNHGIEQSSNVLVTRVKLSELNMSEIYTVGVENDSLVKSKYHFQNNISNAGLIVNERLAQTLNLKKKNTVEIENKMYTVEEVIKDYDAAGVVPDIIIMSRNNVKKIISDTTGRVVDASFILIKVQPQLDPLTIANQFRKQFTDLRIDIAKEDESVKSNLNSLNKFLIILSVLLLIVTSLLIIANFDMFLYKYKNQFAILRTLGATSKQLFEIAFIQSSIINLMGAAGGLLVSYLFHNLMQGWLGSLFSSENPKSSFNFIYAVLLTLGCIIIIEFFMLVPSYRISKMLPIRIWRENEKLDFSRMKTRRKIGKFLFFLSLVVIFIALMATLLDEKMGALFIVFPSILLILSLALLMPVYVPSIFIFLLPIIKFLFGRISYVAIKNVIPQVRKNTLVMMSITIMIIISIFGSATLKTVSNNAVQYLEKQYATNILATSRLGYNSTIDHIELKKAITSIQSIESVTEISTPSRAVLIKDNSQSNFDYILGDLEEMSREGLLPSLLGGDKNKVVFTNDYAQKYHIKIGDEVSLGLYSSETKNVIPTGKVVVANLVDKIAGTSLPAILDWSNETYNNKFTIFNKAFIKSKNSEETLHALEKLQKEYPELNMNSLEQSLKDAQEISKQRWSIYRVFIFVITLCVMVGIIETLISNIHSKRKELAVLRIMNIGKNGVRTIIFTQIILYLLFGIIFGGISGILLTFTMNLIDTQAGVVSFDFTNLIEIITLMLGMTTCVFVPFANKLTKTNIANELTNDNK